MNDLVVGSAVPIGSVLPSLERQKKPAPFRHSDEWRADMEKLVDELFSTIDALMIRVSALEQQNSALSYKLHKMQYAGVDE